MVSSLNIEELSANRGFYTDSIARVKANIDNRRRVESRVKVLQKDLLEKQTLYVRMLNAQKVLSTVSDDNTRATLDFVTGMVNKVLLELFPKEPYTIKLDNKLHAGTKPHIVMELLDSEGNVLDISTQSGDGIKQVICFMYVVCLIEIRKGRRLVILDERLNGLHRSAKKCIASIMEILSKGGFQFVFVEYGLNDFGKIYNVERKMDTVSGGMISELRSVDDGRYDDEIIYIDDVDMNAVDMTVEE